MVAGRRPLPGHGRLDAWFNGERVGCWHVQPGEHRFTYDEAWRASPAARPLSVSLPFTPGNVPHRGETVSHFFEHLLPPPGRLRRTLQERFGTAGMSAFELLSETGGDCMGALQLLPPGETPGQEGWQDVLPLDEEGLAEALDEADGAPPAASPEWPGTLRVALAGTTPKTALLLYEGRWCRPLGWMPTSHLFKLPVSRSARTGTGTGTAAQHAVENEWLCSRLLNALDLPVASAGMARCRGRMALVSERLDRRRIADANGHDARWLRLPMESLTQALGAPAPALPEHQGGPGMRECLRLLRAGSDPAGDTRCFVRTQFALWLLAAPGGDAGKFMVFIERGGSWRLAPLAGVRSAWPMAARRDGLSRLHLRMAMSPSAEPPVFAMERITASHWLALLADADLPADLLAGVCMSLPQALEQVRQELPSGFPQRVWKAVRQGTQSQARHFLTNLQS